MRKKYDFERLTKPEPEAVKVNGHEPFVMKVLPLLPLATVIFVGIWAVFTIEALNEGPIETFPDTDPAGITCPVCADYPEISFLARTVDALVKAGAKPHEIRDFMVRTYKESGYNPVVVSKSGDHGITQMNAIAHPDVDVERLKSDPVYVVEVWLPYYRQLVKACGDRWQCCYNKGIKGCGGK